MMKLTLYNSLKREKQIFKPMDPKRVTMYNCGPTVYSYAHIGNARAAVVADVLFRVLRHIYGEEHVLYARNLTDIDDKIIMAAAELGVPMSELTEKYARIYNEDLAALNCLEPSFQPKATDNIKEMADLIVELLDKEIAYISEDHVLFDVTKMDNYGKLSGRKLDDNLAGARVKVASYKRNSGDFVLWKPAKDGEPSWKPSNRFPPGRPGWHIECSAMIKRTLGETIDIHCGGVDLKFPHHENEIAQSCCASGLLEEEGPRDENGDLIYLAKFWVHNEFLNMGKNKMSKSKGNVVLVRDLLKEWDGEVIRLALLKAHYRSELIWSEDLLRESKETLDRWYNLKTRYQALNIEDTIQNDHTLNSPSYLFLNNEMSDDVHTPNVISGLSANFKYLSRKVMESELFNSKIFQADCANMYNQIREYTNLLGLLQKDPEEWFRGKTSDAEKAQFKALADARATARKAKDWQGADRVRDEAKALGVVLEDKPDGTTEWRWA
jgi:cysteinyl-tRNA synthetase